MNRTINDIAFELDNRRIDWHNSGANPYDYEFDDIKFYLKQLVEMGLLEVEDEG